MSHRENLSQAKGIEVTFQQSDFYGPVCHLKKFLDLTTPHACRKETVTWMQVTWMQVDKSACHAIKK